MRSVSEARQARNRQAMARLDGATPAIFPQAVLVHARACTHVPPLPRLAVASYWRAHPVRADRLCRALAAVSGHPEGWTWRLASRREGVAGSLRAPPAPFREAAFERGPGSCCICGQPVYRFGWHRDLWGDGAVNRRARWHACCVAAWTLWTAPSAHAVLLRRLQRRRCAVTRRRLLRSSEVDHRVPLATVWREHRDTSWPELLRFWGIANLQVVVRDAHAAKTSAEAAQRARTRTLQTREAQPFDVAP